MKFMYVPAGPYNLGQIIVVNGKEVRVGGKSYLREEPLRLPTSRRVSASCSS